MNVLSVRPDYVNDVCDASGFPTGTGRLERIKAVDLRNGATARYREIPSLHTSISLETRFVQPHALHYIFERIFYCQSISISYDL